jgi:PhnB protein
MQVSLHLTFRGQCEAAFKFYERCLGGTIGSMLTYGESPMAEQVPLEWRSKVVHASMTVGGTVLAGSDALPEQYVQPHGFYVLLGIGVPADAERMFHALAENGKVEMVIQKTFWSPGFGVLVDQFGIPWEISCEQAPSAT